MRRLLVILFVLLPFLSSFPQLAFNWKNYTDMKNVRAIFSTPEGVWAASTGGAFYYNYADSSYIAIHKTDGLVGAALTAVTEDNSGNIWFGSATGVINVLNPKSMEIIPIMDISASDKSSKKINELRVVGDTIIVSTDFGVSLINSKTFQFFDTFFKFGSFSSNIKVNSALKENRIFVATESGVAVQKPGSINPSAPESWDVYKTTEGLPSNNVKKLAIFKGEILAATEKGIAKFNGTSWELVMGLFFNNDVSDIFPKGDSLFILTKDNIYVQYGETSKQLINSLIPLINFSYSEKLGILVGSTQGILRLKNEFSPEYFFPNGPAVNQFPSMKVDNKGTLWSASGKDVTGMGFYKFQDGYWHNYNMANTPELPTNFYYSVYTSSDNSVYFGSWGVGFVRIRDRIDQFNTKNTAMRGIDVNPDFLVITDFASDSKNNLWILNWGAVNQNTLSMLTPDSTWHHFSIPAENTYLGQHFSLIIDQYNTKWFSSRDPKRAGLYYFNENNTYTNPGDDISGYLSRNNGLNNNDITALAIDRRGDIWVGTSLGVNVISNTGTILSSSTPQLRISSVFTLRQQTINCIAVDPLNQKWVGTNQGLLLVNSDGTYLIAALDSKNSPLLADEIRSIAIDENIGKIYVGTDAGLTSFETAAIKPQEAFSELFIYPSPFKINNSSGVVTIDGLIRDTEIKILSVNGKLINHFPSPGGRIAYWNGKDLNGQYVSSGIYFIIAFDKDGNSVATGKIAVLRE
jgi:ligand-binding sensor domain-containing protein